MTKPRIGRPPEVSDEQIEQAGRQLVAEGVKVTAGSLYTRIKRGFPQRLKRRWDEIEAGRTEQSIEVAAQARRIGPEAEAAIRKALEATERVLRDGIGAVEYAIGERAGREFEELAVEHRTVVAAQEALETAFDDIVAANGKLEAEVSARREAQLAAETRAATAEAGRQMAEDMAKDARSRCRAAGKTARQAEAKLAATERERDVAVGELPATLKAYEVLVEQLQRQIQPSETSAAQQMAVSVTRHRELSGPEGQG